MNSMERRITNEELMKFLDQELAPDDRARIERELSTSTELQRDLARYRHLRADLRSLGADIDAPGMWSSLHRKLTKPLGWLLLVAGALLWTGWGSWLYFTSDENLIMKFAMGGITIGFVLLLAGTLHERWIEWKSDPYRDIER